MVPSGWYQKEVELFLLLETVYTSHSKISNWVVQTQWSPKKVCIVKGTTQKSLLQPELLYRLMMQPKNNDHT